jgi:hypothetical protein
MTPSSAASNAGLWTGRAISTLVVLFLVFDGVTKLMKVPQVIQASTRLGLPQTTVSGIGAVLLVSTLVYVIPRTSVLGAILLTAYLGGATAANVRALSPAFNTGFPIVFGVLVWLGLFLREERLRALIPLRRSKRVPDFADAGVAK